MRRTIQVAAIAVQSSDGFISRKEATTEKSTGWASAEDTRRFKEMTTRARVIIMGNATFKTFGNKPLPKRLNIVYTRDPALLAQAWTERLGYTDMSPDALLETLQNSGYTEVFICGGTQVYDMFRPHMDYLYLTTEPVEFGDGIPLFSDPTFMPTHNVSHEEVEGTHFDIYSFS